MCRLARFFSLSQRKRRPVELCDLCAAPRPAARKFQPVNVASGTETSGIRTPPRSIPSASTCGTSTGNAPVTFGGSCKMMPRDSNSGPKSRRRANPRMLRRRNALDGRKFQSRKRRQLAFRETRIDRRRRRDAVLYPCFQRREQPRCTGRWSTTLMSYAVPCFVIGRLRGKCCTPAMK